jgi:hypothetical protein
MRPFESAGPWTLPSEKVTTQVRIGAGHSKEERQRIICCCRQVLHQESEPLGERFGRTSEDQAISPKTADKIALSKSIISATVEISDFTLVFGLPNPEKHSPV